jgi:hypothetical protein
MKRTRWTGTTERQRQSWARQARQQPGSGAGAGRPRLPDRCPCGRYTRWLAAKRGHLCMAEALH